MTGNRAFGTPRPLIVGRCGFCANCLAEIRDREMLERAVANGAGGEILGSPRNCLREEEAKRQRDRMELE